jgi:Peptidase C13 family
MKMLIRFAPILLAAVAARADNYYLTVAGLGGEDQYEQKFTGWTSDLTKLLKNEPGAKVDSLSGKDATKANLEAKLRAIAQTSKADDAFVLVLIGHGTYDSIDYKFNLPGHDISATELAGLLDKIQARQVVVLGTSCSGAAIPALQKAKRVVITATKSGTENNATVFARFWVEAMRDPAADTDKNELVSVLEAFDYAQAKTTNYYNSQKHLATEHALIEDTGKGEGQKDATPDNGEGLIARRITLLHLGSVASIVNDPEKQKLLKRKDELETAIDELKYRKAAMELSEYQRQMQAFLLELARVQAELDK